MSGYNRSAFNFDGGNIVWRVNYCETEAINVRRDRTSAHQLHSTLPYGCYWPSRGPSHQLIDTASCHREVPNHLFGVCVWNTRHGNYMTWLEYCWIPNDWVRETDQPIQQTLLFVGRERLERKGLLKGPFSQVSLLIMRAYCITGRIDLCSYGKYMLLKATSREANSSNNFNNFRLMDLTLHVQYSSSYCAKDTSSTIGKMNWNSHHATLHYWKLSASEAHVLCIVRNNNYEDKVLFVLL